MRGYSIMPRTRLRPRPRLTARVNPTIHDAAHRTCSGVARAYIVGLTLAANLLVAGAGLPQVDRQGQPYSTRGAASDV